MDKIGSIERFAIQLRRRKLRTQLSLIEYAEYALETINLEEWK